MATHRRSTHWLYLALALLLGALMVATWRLPRAAAQGEMAQLAAGQDRWSGTFGWPGADGAVNALVMDGAGQLYAGGDFTSIGGVSCARVARWSGGAWHPLGSGVNGLVKALAVDGAGHLYVSGHFTRAGGLAAQYIARWDGDGWHDLGGANDSVEALALDGDGNLYIGGYFTQVGGVNAQYVARWGGGAWSALGSGLNGPARALAWDGSGLYVGGNFAQAGGLSANHVARWNGSAWQPLGSGVNDAIRALAWDGSGLYVGGHFTQAGGHGANYVARWSGGAWQPLGGGVSDVVRALALDSLGHLYAGGHFTHADGGQVRYVTWWDGGGWRALGGGLNDAALALAVDGRDNLYAGGSFTLAGASAAYRLARWAGLGTLGVAPAVRGSIPGATQLLTASYWDGEGYDDLRYAYLLVNATESLTNCLYLRYDVSSGLLHLRRPDDQAWLGGHAPGTASTIAHSFGAVDVSRCAVLTDTDRLTVTWALAPSWRMSGTQYDVSLRAESTEGALTDWMDHGDWVVNRAPSSLIPPDALNSVIPRAAQITLNPRYRDLDGWPNLNTLYLAIADILPGGDMAPGGVFLKYDQRANLLYLADSAGTHWGAGVTPRADAVLQNQDVRVICQWSYPGAADARTRIMYWRLAFEPAFAGRHQVYMRAVDALPSWGGDTGWMWKGWLQVRP